MTHKSNNKNELMRIKEQNVCTQITSRDDLTKQKDDAVSEVIGVLLILSITIILVGVVALLANGVVVDNEVPITANIVATEVDNGSVIFELISGDSFSLDDIRLRLGIRENTSQYIILTRIMEDDLHEYFVSDSGDIMISLGDRFRVVGTNTTSKINFGAFSVNKGQHLSYVFFDKTGAPLSSGVILVKR